MESKIKKIIGITLLVCVVLSVTVLTASAAEVQPTQTVVYFQDGVVVKACTSYNNGVTVCQTSTGKTTMTFSEGTEITGSR